MEIFDKVKGFNISILKRKMTYNMPIPHIHNHYEIYYLMYGTRDYYINGKVYKIRAGDLMLIKKGDLHKTSFVKYPVHQRVLISFSEEYIYKFNTALNPKDILKCFDVPVISLPKNKQSRIEEMFYKMDAEHKNPDDFSDMLVYNYLMEFLVFLNRHINSFITTPCSKEDFESNIYATIRYINQNYQSKLTLEEVSELNGLSRFHFSRKFKETTGLGFNQYLNSIRIEAAIKELLQTENSITEIAYLCGFQDSSYFTNVFKKNMGISPSYYRKTKGFELMPRIINSI